MCLTRSLRRETKQEWLAQRPDTVKGWKVVHIKIQPDGTKKLYPSMRMGCRAFKKTNKKLRNAPRKNLGYSPNYHIWATKSGAKSWGVGNREVLLRCEIPKNQITCIGELAYHTVIVTKEFTFVDVDEYFGEL